jgi:hypothetical protein
MKAKVAVIVPLLVNWTGQDQSATASDLGTRGILDTAGAQKSGYATWDSGDWPLPFSDLAFNTDLGWGC